MARSRSESLSNGHWMQPQRICARVFDQVEPTRSPWTPFHGDRTLPTHVPHPSEWNFLNLRGVEGGGPAFEGGSEGGDPPPGKFQSTRAISHGKTGPAPR